MTVVARPVIEAAEKRGPGARSERQRDFVVFVFFSNRLGCLGSIAVSLLVSLLLLKHVGSCDFIRMTITRAACRIITEGSAPKGPSFRDFAPFSDFRANSRALRHQIYLDAPVLRVPKIA